MQINWNNAKTFLKHFSDCLFYFCYADCLNSDTYCFFHITMNNTCILLFPLCLHVYAVAFCQLAIKRIWMNEWMNECVVGESLQLQRSSNTLLYNSTPWTIKTCHFVLIITLAFLGRFLYVLHQWKEEGILYTEVNKMYHFTLTVSPHYLKIKRNINSTFW